MENQPADRITLIQKVVQALTDDYHRQGEYLTADRVIRAVEKRGLDIEDEIAIRQQLKAAGIDIDDPEPLLGDGADEYADVTSDDLVRRYLAEIGASRLLRPDEEVRLGRRVQVGLRAQEALAKQDLPPDVQTELRKRVVEGHAAAEEFIVANLRLVVSIAKRYVGRSDLELLDLVQEGSVGLMKAVEKFDHKKGFKFSTYATWWIRQTITRALADRGSVIRLPVWVRDSLLRINKVARALARADGGREPTTSEVAEQLGLPPEKVQFLLDISNHPISLESPTTEEGGRLADLMRSGRERTPEAFAMQREREMAIEAALGALDDRQQRIITRRFGLDSRKPNTLEELGQAFGLTRERVRQIEAKALDRLRHPVRSTALKPFWPKTDAPPPPVTKQPGKRRRPSQMDRKGSH